MNLENKIQAILFWKGEPVSIKKLTEILKSDLTQITEAIKNLKESLKNSGVILMEVNDEVTLGTNPELTELISGLTKEELMKDLGKAGLETLAIILYKGTVSRAEVDYIRGVNSQFIIRNLLVRGLVERVSNPNDSRSYLYKPTFDLLSHLGVSNVKELPEFEKIITEIKNIEENKENGNEATS